MFTPLDNVGRRHLVFGLYVRSPPSFVRSYGQMLLPRYLMNGLSSFHETYNEYLLAPNDDRFGFWR